MLLSGSKAQSRVPSKISVRDMLRNIKGRDGCKYINPDGPGDFGNNPNSI